MPKFLRLLLCLVLGFWQIWMLEPFIFGPVPVTTFWSKTLVSCVCFPYVIKSENSLTFAISISPLALRTYLWFLLNLSIFLYTFSILCAIGLCKGIRRPRGSCYGTDLYFYENSLSTIPFYIWAVNSWNSKSTSLEFYLVVRKLVSAGTFEFGESGFYPIFSTTCEFLFLENITLAFGSGP